MSEEVKLPVPAKDILEQIDPQLLQNLPPDQRERVIKVVNSVAISIQGPLPPPQMLAEYDRLIPNGADRLMALLERQAAHRQALESANLAGRLRLGSSGQWLGATLCIILAIIGWNLTVTGHDWVGGTIFGTTIIGLVVVFVRGRAPGVLSKSGSPAKPPARKKAA